MTIPLRSKDAETEVRTGTLNARTIVLANSAHETRSSEKRNTPAIGDVRINRWRRVSPAAWNPVSVGMSRPRAGPEGRKWRAVTHNRDHATAYCEELTADHRLKHATRVL